MDILLSKLRYAHEVETDPKLKAQLAQRVRAREEELAGAVKAYVEDDGMAYAECVALWENEPNWR